MSLLLALIITSACSAKGRAIFHPTDPSFSPAPGRTPRAYTQHNIEDVPRALLRSVGIIEVTTAGNELESAVDFAIEKGRELGCWIVIEHAAFLRLGPATAWLEGGATVFLAHGSHDHRPVVRPPTRTMRFDCIVPRRATSTSA